MTAISTGYKIVKELCKRELFREATEMVNFILDNDDDGEILKISNEEYDNKLEELTNKEEELMLNEPNPDQNYDAWVTWEANCIEVENQQKELQKQLTDALGLVEEWWFCSKWMGEQLQGKGEVVIFYKDFAIWGRQWSNFDPYIDTVFKNIASDIEILPGQKHDWSKHFEQK